MHHHRRPCRCLLLLLLGLALAPASAHAAEGDLQWAQQLFSTAGILPTAMTTDPAGNVLFAGRLYATGTFQPGGIAVPITNGNQGQALLIAKFSPSGDFLWLRSALAFTRLTTRSLTTDAEGNLTVTGVFRGTADMDPGDGVTLINSGGVDQVFAAKYGADGSFQWVRTWSAASAYATTDAAGNVLVCGHFSKAILIPGGPELQAAGTHDAFAVKLDPSGAPLWSRVLASENNDEAAGIATDPAGNVYLLGTAGPGEFRLEDTLLRRSDALLSDFVIKLDPQGVSVWDGYFPGSLKAIAVDGTQNVYVAGEYNQVIEFGGTTYPSIGTGSQGMLFKLSASGSIAWFRKIASDQKATGLKLSLGSDNRVLVGGSFSGNLSLGAPQYDLPAPAALDVFLAAYDTAGTLQYTRRIAGEYEVYLYSLNATHGDATYLTGISIIPNGSPSVPAPIDANPGGGTLELDGWGGYLIKLDGTTSPGGPAPIHSADTDSDHRVSISELLRLIQFYNLDGLHCEGAPGESEDGFLPGTGPNAGCRPHAADYNPQDWHINISEVLRVVQFYNLGSYHLCTDAASEDGYCPG